LSPLATIAAAADLWLHMAVNRKKDAKKKIWLFHFTDDFGSKVDVVITVFPGSDSRTSRSSAQGRTW
jgi:hypothetical protein